MHAIHVLKLNVEGLLFGIQTRHEVSSTTDKRERHQNLRNIVSFLFYQILQV